MLQIRLEQERVELHPIIKQPPLAAPIQEFEIAQLDFSGWNNQDITISLTEQQRSLIKEQTGKDLSVLRIEADKSLYNPWVNSHIGRIIDEKRAPETGWRRRPLPASNRLSDGNGLRPLKQDRALSQAMNGRGPRDERAGLPAPKMGRRQRNE
jgi:hypothetical protein